MKYVFNSQTETSIIEFLYRYLPLNKEKTKRLLSSGEVKINGIKATKNSYVNRGDEIVVFVPLSFEMQLPEIIYEDDNILIADKPVGYEVETSLKMFLEQKYGKLYPVHRLDRNTTGLTIMARNIRAENDFYQAIKKRAIKKYYLAWLEGELVEDNQVMTAFLKKKDDGVIVTDTSSKDSKKIITAYKVLKREGGKTLVEVELITGRTHQIRAHFAFIGHSVVGDSRYGNGSGYQKLRAYKILIDGLEELKYLNGKIFQAEHTTFCQYIAIN